MSISSISGSTVTAAGIIRQQRAQERFDAADTDKSGGLSLEEFQAAGPKDSRPSDIGSNRPNAQDLFNNIDGNSDGSLTQNELETAFQGFQSGAKGVLLAAQEQTSGPPSGRPPQGPPPNGAGGPPPGPPPGGDASGSDADLTSLLTSSSASSSSSTDALGTLISQLQSAINSYSQKSSTTSGTTISQAA